MFSVFGPKKASSQTELLESVNKLKKEQKSLNKMAKTAERNYKSAVRLMEKAQKIGNETLVESLAKSAQIHHEQADKFRLKAYELAALASDMSLKEMWQVVN